jgi:hypothetical protein
MHNNHIRQYEIHESISSVTVLVVALVGELVSVLFVLVA